MAGSPGVARATLATVDRRPEPVEFRAEAVGHPGGHVDVDRPIDGGRERCCGERGVAARRDRQARSVGEVTDPLGGQQVQQDGDEMSRLLAAGHSPGLVLDPDAAVGGEPEGVGQ